MFTTIVDAILNPKYQKEYNFKNIDEKVEICTTLKAMEQEILSCLDSEHRKMFKKIDYCSRNNFLNKKIIIFLYNSP